MYINSFLISICLTDDSGLNDTTDHTNNSVFYNSVEEAQVQSLPECSRVDATSQRKSVGQQFTGKFSNLRNKFKKSKSTDQDCSGRSEYSSAECQRCRVVSKKYTVKIF